MTPTPYLATTAKKHSTSDRRDSAGSVPALSPEEPLSSVAYCHDGTLEGLLSAVFAVYERRESPQDVTTADQLQLRLGQSVCHIETNEQHALRVRAGIQRACGQAVFEAVAQASLSDDPETGVIVFRFIRLAMKERSRSILSRKTHPIVEPFNRLVRSVGAERHRMMQFLRFEHLENGLWFARCNPTASVVPLIMPWFSARFNTQPFVIFDENHRLAGVSGNGEWNLVRTDGPLVCPCAEEEDLMQAAWKRFYHTVAIESRYNPELRRQFMPKRFWKNIVEMQEDVPPKAPQANDSDATSRQRLQPQLKNLP